MAESKKSTMKNAAAAGAVCSLCAIGAPADEPEYTYIDYTAPGPMAEAQPAGAVSVDYTPQGASTLVLTLDANAFDITSVAPAPERRLAFMGRDVLRIERPDLSSSVMNDPFTVVTARPLSVDRGAQSYIEQLVGGPQRDDTISASVAFNDNSGWRRSSRFAGLDVDVSPRANITVGNISSGAGAGALVRIGQNLVKEGRNPRSGQWFLFAGADAQAVTWRPDSSPLIADGGVAVQEMVMIGDAQAGIAWRLGKANLAVGFVHREFSWEGATIEEQFGGISISWTN